jgi:hypothetical protein
MKPWTDVERPLRRTTDSLATAIIDWLHALKMLPPFIIAERRVVEEMTGGHISCRNRQSQWREEDCKNGAKIMMGGSAPC